MAERIVERTDGTTERVADSGSTVVVERSGGGGAGLLIGLVLLVAVVIGALYLVNQNSRENVETKAVAGAAEKVGDAAEKAGDAVTGATK
jgi:Na+-transporting methylmalonyl-CoA/oxaloacetate decarboxylase gamma subunit